MPNRHVRSMLFVLLTLAGCAASTTSAQPAPAASPTTAPAAQAQPAKPSGTYFAQRTLRITRRGEREGDFGVAELSSPAVAGELAKTILGVPLDQYDRFVTADLNRTADEDTYDVMLRVNLCNAPPGARAAAQEMTDALVQRLRDLAVNPLRSRVDAADVSRAKAEQRVDSTTGEIDALRKQVRANTGRVDVDPERINGEVSRLEEQREQVRLELEAKQARRDALTRSIDELSKQMSQRPVDDPVLAELQNVVDARQKAADRLRKVVDSGQATQSELDQAVSAAAEARAKMLERRAAASDAAGGDALAGWNKELRTLSVDTAELEARLKALTSRLDQLGKSMPEVERIEQLAQARERLRQDLARLEDRVEELHQQQSQLTPPRIVLVHTIDKPGPVPNPTAPEAALSRPARSDESRETAEPATTQRD